MKYSILLFILALILFVSCGSGSKKANTKEEEIKNANIVSRKEMRHIMIDVLFVESAIINKQIEYGDARYYTIKYYNYIFVKNNITPAQYEKSLNYYTLHPEDMVKIMSEVVDSLSLLQGEIHN